MKESTSIPSPAKSGFEQLFQSLFNAAILTDMNGRILDANRRASLHLMYDHPDLCSMSVLDIIDHADNDLINLIHKTLKNNRETIIKVYCRRKNHSKYLSEIAVSKIVLKEECLVFHIRDLGTKE